MAGKGGGGLDCRQAGVGRAYCKGGRKRGVAKGVHLARNTAVGKGTVPTKGRKKKRARTESYLIKK